jgi:hypothetical protein
MVSSISHKNRSSVIVINNSELVVWSKKNIDLDGHIMQSAPSRNSAGSVISSKVHIYFLYDSEKRIAPNVHLIADDYHCKWKYAVQTALHQSAQP